MTRRSVVAVLVSITVLTFGVGPVGAATVTFDDVVVGPNNPVQGSVNSGGFNFTSTHFHIANNAPFCGFGGCVGNGTQYALEDAPALAGPITMTRIGGGTFALTSFDGAEVFLDSTAAASGGFPNAAYIRVVGNLSGGGSIVTYFALDGVKDGNGGAADFQHFVFGLGWTNLTSAVWSGTLGPGTGTGGASLSFDNIVVDAVAPEPGTLLLLGSALTGAALSARRRRRNT
jgi:PEP-CTERM motif